ncbi:putative multidrug resistance-associated protein lethal(2)03659, partial [Aphis craccivora]
MTLDDQLSSSLGDELEKEWRLELTNAYSANRKPSMTRTFVKLFAYKYLSIGFLFALNDIVFKVSRPLLVSGFLAYFNPDGSTTTDLNHAYIYATGIVFTLLMTMILQHLGSEKNLECAMKMRVSSCSLIYRKYTVQKGLCGLVCMRLFNLIINKMDFTNKELSMMALLLDEDEQVAQEPHRYWRYWVHTSLKKLDNEGEFQTLY